TKAIQSFSADFTSEAAGEKVKGRIVFGKNKLRMDVTALGVSMSIIADHDKKTAYMYNPEDKTALSMPYDQAVTQAGHPGDVLNWEKGITAPPRLLGEETVDGKACAVYEFTTAETTSKSWIDKATGFPIKSESTADGQTTSIHFTDVRIGNIDESLLALPADTMIQDLSGLMGGQATPADTRATPTTLAVSPAGQGSSDPIDCGTELDCFIEASRTGRLAKVDYTMSMDFFGMFLANTDSLAIKGKDGDTLLFSQQTIAADAAPTEAIIKAAQAKGMSPADAQKALTTAKGVAELMQAASTHVDPEIEKQLNSAKESQRARTGLGKECRFPQPALTAMLERWRDGKFSSSDYDPGQCTDLTADAQPAASAGEPKLVDASVLPAELKAIPLPSGFGVVDGSATRSAPGGVFESAEASLFGKLKVEELHDFYTSSLAAEWDEEGWGKSTGGGTETLQASYISKKGDLTLTIDAEGTAEGTTVNIKIKVEKD
ncbi:MAG: LolA family protein, partial [Bacteroidota bacterium]